MVLEELIFEKNKILTVIAAIEDLCLSCAGLAVLCSECPADPIKKDLSYLPVSDTQDYFPLIREFERLTGDLNISFRELIFDKNKIMLAQNAVEELCLNCSGAGILCGDCTVHQARRTIASLPIKDSELFSPKSAPRAKAAKSCGTSCSTGCGTKK
jgi:hypothetical protein